MFGVLISLVISLFLIWMTAHRLAVHRRKREMAYRLNSVIEEHYEPERSISS